LDFIVTLQAESCEGSSATLRLRLSWDGKWEDGDLEMAAPFHDQRSARTATYFDRSAINGLALTVLIFNSWFIS
jgi:hypothetical protein